MDSRDILILGAVGVGAWFLFQSGLLSGVFGSPQSTSAAPPLPIGAGAIQRSGMTVDGAQATQYNAPAHLGGLIATLGSRQLLGPGFGADSTRFKAAAASLLAAQAAPATTPVIAPIRFPTLGGSAPIGSPAATVGPRPQPLYFSRGAL